MLFGQSILVEMTIPNNSSEAQNTYVTFLAWKLETLIPFFYLCYSLLLPILSSEAATCL
jgi:hypothetical protein